MKEGHSLCTEGGKLRVDKRKEVLAGVYVGGRIGIIRPRLPSLSITTTHHLHHHHPPHHHHHQPPPPPKKGRTIKERNKRDTKTSHQHCHYYQHRHYHQHRGNHHPNLDHHHYQAPPPPPPPDPPPPLTLYSSELRSSH